MKWFSNEVNEKINNCDLFDRVGDKICKRYTELDFKKIYNNNCFNGVVYVVDEIIFKHIRIYGVNYYFNEEHILYFIEDKDYINDLETEKLNNIKNNLLEKYKK